MAQPPVIIGLTGYARVGKDTAAEFIHKSFGYSRRAFADPLRQMAERIDPLVHRGGPFNTNGVRYTEALDIYGYEQAKDLYPEVREFLKGLGNAAREILDKDIWVKACLNSLPRYSVVSDVRFINEAERLRLWAKRHDGDALIVRISRPGYKQESDFEREVDLIDADLVVENGGTVEDFHLRLEQSLGDVCGLF